MPQPFSEAALLDSINQWCAEHCVRPLAAKHLGAPVGTASSVIGFRPEMSYANPGKQGMMTFDMGRVKDGIAVPKYITSRRVHAWIRGVPPVMVEAVMVVPLIRLPNLSIHVAQTQTYRPPLGDYALEPARGYASDIDYRGEEATGYNGHFLPESLWQAERPEDGILGLRAAQGELREEVSGGITPSQVWYLGYFAEADTFAHMYTSLWLATFDAPSLEDVVPGTPDGSQRELRFIAVSQMDDLLTGRILSGTVRAANLTALSLLRKTEREYHGLKPLWTGKFKAAGLSVVL